MQIHVLFTFLIGIAHTVLGLKPMITFKREEFLANPYGPDLIVEAGSNFSLQCMGASHVNISLPFYQRNLGTMMRDTFVNISSWYQADNPLYPYVANIYLESVTFAETGYYKCYTDGNDDDVASVYVFVQDEDFLMTEIPHGGTTVEYNTYLIGCRPTSPSINVTLWKDDERVDNVKYEGLTVTYDHREGFTLHRINIINAGYYACKAHRPSDGMEMEEETNIIVLPHTDFVPKPSINNTNVHQVVNSRLTLQCTVTANSDVHFMMNWTVPDTVSLKSNRVQIHSASAIVVTDQTGLEKKIATRLLTITNTELSDTGDYICVVKDHTHKKNSETARVEIFGADIKYINMSTPLTINVISGISSVKWVVEIAAYPKVNLTWYTPEGLPISTNNHGNKYDVTVGEYEAKLVINRVTIRDAGIYKLKAVNSYEEKILNLTLLVNDKPTVKLVIPDVTYYQKGRTYQIKCEIIAFPAPNIEWRFRRCDNPAECHHNNMAVIESTSITNIQESNHKFVSTLNRTADMSGHITCEAENVEGFGNQTTSFWVTDVADGFSVTGPEVIVIGDNVTLDCGVSKYNYMEYIAWYYLPQLSNSTSPILLANNYSSEISLESKSTQFSHQKRLTIRDIGKKHAGQYTCQTKTDKGGEDSRTRIIIVKDLQAPKIVRTNMNDTELLVVTSSLVEWHCESEGMPQPTVVWYKDSSELLIAVDDKRYQLKNSNQTLVIQYSTMATEGSYSCIVTNRAGQVSRSMTLRLKDKPPPNTGIIVAVVVISIVLVCLIVFLLFKIRKEQKMRRELKTIGLDQFDKGAMENINPELPIDDQAELLPYDRKWEFPRDKLKLGKQLGAGAFGVVMKADAFGITEGEVVSTVAVKMVKRNADHSYIKALASELKIMVHLGQHLNVVNLLGACTKNLTKKELFVIVEYCRFGNLHNYLLRHRAEFIDQIDPTTGLIDPNKGADIIANHEAMTSKRASDSETGLGTLGDYRAIVSHSTSGVDSEMTLISLAPSGGEDGPMMSNNSIQPEWRSNYGGDYKGNVRPICTRDLVCWAFQVARGMEYLAGRKVLHGDLAARNILLSDDNIVKICDFGLAKSMYKSDNYKKKGDGPLPVKWMAIESIRDRVFSTQSDIWSFGIVLWEFFSLARTPYPGMEADEKLYNKLVSGYRMDKPEYATNDVYNIMDNCWLAKPTERPSFGDLATQLGAMLEESVRMHYIDLNDPYINMNDHWKEGETNDYLAMMSAPTYDNMVAPGAESVDDIHQYVNNSIVPNGCAVDPDLGENSGYLCMKSPAAKEGPPIFSPRTATSSNVFDFTPQHRRPRDEPSAKEHEIRPMLSLSRGSDSDNEYKSPNLIAQPVNNLNRDSDSERKVTEKTLPNITPSFSNPSYQTMGTISPTPDNYVNMPQQKIGVMKDDENKSPVSFSNPNYVAMGNMNDVNNQSAMNATRNGGTEYMNIP